MISWIIRNASWVFSGIGVVILGFFINKFILTPPALEPLNMTKEFVELVVDSSAAMEQTLGNTTKMELAVKNLKYQLAGEISESGELALRIFSGSCDSRGSRLVVPFGRNHEKKIKRRLDRLTPNGKAPLVAAIGDAIGDFINDARRRQGIVKKIIVITSGEESCKRYYSSEEKIKEKFQEFEKDYKRNITKFKFHFIGMKSSKEQYDNIIKIAEIIEQETEAPLPRVIVVNNEQEFGKAIKDALFSTEVAAVDRLPAANNTRMNRVSRKPEDSFRFTTSNSSFDFRITFPEKNEEVRGEIIEIEGRGAIQGTVIEVSVLTNDWYIQDGKAEINKDGTWTYAPCYLAGKGKFNNHTIRARLFKDGEIMATTKVRGVVRK